MVVQIVFSDESGVGNRKKEPITVVTAIVFNMDREWGPVSTGLQNILFEAIGSHKSLLEKGRALKGKLLYSAVRKGIPGADGILRSILQVVANHRITVFYGAVDRDEFEKYRGSAKATQPEKRMTPFDKAFEQCFQMVDRVARSFTNEQVL